MLSENLFKLRKRHNMTQEQVANRLAVSRQAVAKWEAGETCPDLSNCVALARLYDVALDDLVNYSERESGLPLPPKGKHSFGTVPVGENGEIVLPVKALELFHIQPGDNLLVLGDEGSGLALIQTELMVAFLNQIQGKEERQEDTGSP